jgi:gluconate 5-dehydrogenase
MTGQVAIITGASRGLGLQIASALGEFGCSLALVARKQADLDDAVASLRDQGFAATAFVADLSKPDASASLVTSVLERLGRIDVLVNNAGTTWGDAAEDFPTDAWNKVLNLNVTSMFLLTQAVAQSAFIPQGGGSVVNVASILGLVGTPHWQTGTVAYNAAKGAVISMTRALAAEWGPKSIRVNALAPGFFPSKMTAATINRNGNRMIELTPLGKLGGDTDLMGSALLLASAAGGHITGQVIVVDGGSTII